MKMNKSKKFWLKIDKEIPKKEFKLGSYSSQGLFEDPSSILFRASRYKFCSKLLANSNNILEIGCGDAFSSTIVSQTVKNLVCTDINKQLLIKNKKQMNNFKNIQFKYHDFLEKPFKVKMDGIYLIDVIEHIFKNEEKFFFQNIIDSLNNHGVCIIGTPNKSSSKYASKFSKKSHVNLKDYKNLQKIGKKYFHNSFMFSMNDEVVHTGFYQMSHYLWLLGVSKKF